MLIMNKESFELNSASRVVKASDVEKIETIDAVIEAARKEGYEAGLQEGRMKAAMHHLNLVEAGVKYMESVEQTMADIVLKALKKCIDSIPNEELIVGITKKAMKAIVRNQAEITIRVNPTMVEYVKTRAADIMKEFPSLNYLDVQEDSKLDEKACVVETAAGSVDASIDVQLAAIERSIRKNFSKEA